jgi:hypothetical protein
MSVSKYRSRDQGQQVSDAERAAAVGWLQRQLAWEHVLNEMRRAAGVGSVPGTAQSAGGQLAASGDSRSAA